MAVLGQLGLGPPPGLEWEEHGVCQTNMMGHRVHESVEEVSSWPAALGTGLETHALEIQE